MKINTLLLTTALAAGAAFQPSVATAFGNPNSLSDADDLVIASGETHVLSPGLHSFDDLVFGEDATIVIHDTTTITANRIHSEQRDAVIRYEPQPDHGAAVLDVHVLDGEAMSGLRIVGHGADGRDAPSSHAAAGEHGRNAKIERSGFLDLKIHNRSAGRGGDGADGADGGRGGNALDVRLYVVGAAPGTIIEVDAVGGTGGAGQPGGNGGNGGNGNLVRENANGGVAGDGGAGGRGGDAPHVQVWIIPDDGGEAQADWVFVGADIAAGLGGDGGARGEAGRRGRDGNRGADGPLGDGPRLGEPGDDRVQVRVMDREVYMMRRAINLDVAQETRVTN